VAKQGKGVVLGIRLRFHNHAPQQLAIHLALHQQAADQLRRNLLGRAGVEALGKVLGEGGGYGGGLGDGWRLWKSAGICRDCTKALRQSAVAFCDILTISARVEESEKIENT